MAREFEVPAFYRSPVVSAVKLARRLADPRKKDLSPSVVDFGPVRFKLARHFGFCYGVENAIEIAYRAITENEGRRIFLLSEMIHNPHVNEDLAARGVRFLRSTRGDVLIPLDELMPDDVVIVPAFGASIEVLAAIRERGACVDTYDTTCPFVEKVWKRSEQIGRQDFTIVVHGKRYHEETRATFSHAKEVAPVVVVRDRDEAERLASIIRGVEPVARFETWFRDRYSLGFDPARDLERIGVVNQTTMLASETREIADILRRAVVERYGPDHFADTSDTLCYATNENQDATVRLIDDGADLALVVGGFNSSNTSHLVELCERRMPTYFISGPESIHSRSHIEHFDYPAKKLLASDGWFPQNDGVNVLLTAGASCPDMLLDGVIRKIVSWHPEARTVEEAIAPFTAAQTA